MKPFSGNGLQLPTSYHQALHQEALQRSNLFYSGVLRYIHSPFPGGEQLSDKRRILGKSSKNGTLYYYASTKTEQAAARPLILCIPSLLNRHYILDLKPDASLLSHLNAQGFDCILLEWPIAKEEDSSKETADYALMLLEILQEHWGAIDRPLIVLGYCMGGILALALAQLFSRVKGIILLATPWDYSQYPLASLPFSQQRIIDEWVEQEPLFAPEGLQILWYLANPYRLYQRFSRFAQEKSEETIASFVALEHWANDVVPISQAVARECLITWPRQNQLSCGKWCVSGERILPQHIKVPTLLAIPQQDHIVPSAVSEPLMELLPHLSLLRPKAGHVGMIAGLQRRQLWDGLANWLAEHF